MAELLQQSSVVYVPSDSQSLSNPQIIAQYYGRYGYNKLWTDTNAGKGSCSMLFEMLRYADSVGLNPNDYHQKYFDKICNAAGINYSNINGFEPENELIFTDAALSFLYDVAYGKDIAFSYNGIKPGIDSSKISEALNQLIETRNWRSVLYALEPKSEQYKAIKKYYKMLSSLLEDERAVDAVAASTTTSGIYEAEKKLRCFGLIAGDSLNPAQMKAAIAAFQRLMSLDETGTLDKPTIEQLNVPVIERIRALKESLNYWRWVERIPAKEFVVVNIPAAQLQIINRDSAVSMQMRVIVGKGNTRTPRFAAYITGVVTYPYWNVPFSIATKEMLPKIRKSTSYLSENNLQVLNTKGQVIDPDHVNWKAVTAKNFPYQIRQATGCDNSLGVLKFDLSSPFSVYLHDTNAKDLFNRSNRFLSHGCIRVEKPFDLANYVFTNGLDSSTTQKLMQCVKDEKPETIKLKNKIPVVIWYLLADVDQHGNLKFYKDVYSMASSN